MRRLCPWPASPPHRQRVRVHTRSGLRTAATRFQMDDPSRAPGEELQGMRVRRVPVSVPVWASQEPVTSRSRQTPLLRKQTHFSQSQRRFFEDEMKIFAFISGKYRRANVVQ